MIDLRLTASPSPAALAVALLAMCGCGGENAPPLARVGVPGAEVSLAHGRAAVVETKWELLAPAPGGSGAPQVFVHLFGSGGKPERTFDHALPFAWQAGGTESHTLEIWQSLQDPPLAPGSYTLTFGVYEPASRERWPLDVGGRDGGRRNEYRLASVTVPAGDPAAPRLEFGPGWLPAEESIDRQVLVHRWLTDAGTLEVTGLSAKGVDLELRLLLPRLEGSTHRLSYAEGAGNPQVSVSSPCLAAPAAAEGFGNHRLRLALRPPVEAQGAGGTSCELAFDSNFTYLDIQHLVQRSADLGVVLWQPV